MYKTAWNASIAEVRSGKNTAEITLHDILEKQHYFYQQHKKAIANGKKMIECYGKEHLFDKVKFATSMATKTQN